MSKLVRPGKALEYVNAKLGPRDEGLGRERMMVCRSCPHLEKVKQNEYCGKCGCPHSKDAELKVKTKMVKSKCPESRWPR